MKRRAILQSGLAVLLPGALMGKLSMKVLNLMTATLASMEPAYLERLRSV